MSAGGSKKRPIKAHSDKSLRVSTAHPRGDRGDRGHEDGDRGDGTHNGHKVIRDRRATGLGATAPDGDFDYEAIGGSPWAGSSSSSSDGGDVCFINVDDSDEEERPDTAPAASNAHYSSVLGDARAVVGGQRLRPDTAAAAARSGGDSSTQASEVLQVDDSGSGVAVELDPLKRRDPWAKRAADPGAVHRSEGRGAWARPTSAQSTFRPKSATYYLNQGDAGE